MCKYDVHAYVWNCETANEEKFQFWDENWKLNSVWGCLEAFKGFIKASNGDLVLSFSGRIQVEVSLIED